jgi:hypothetical protein
MLARNRRHASRIRQNSRIGHRLLERFESRQLVFEHFAQVHTQNNR